MTSARQPSATIPPVLGLFVLPTAPDQFFQASRGAARLPPIALSLTCLPLMFAVGRSLHGEPAGWLAALLYGSTPLIVWSHRLAKEESLVTLL